MSQENAKRFMELMNEDEGIQKKVREATESYIGEKPDEKALFNAVIAPVAKEAGLEFTFEDAAELAKSSEEELSEDELSSVAGGASGICAVIGCTRGSSKDKAHACSWVGFGFKKLS